jgi:uncharacterized protein YecE (DUF72 family)
VRLRVGTSGYSYKEWRGTFYPEDLQPAEMLRFYAERLGAVEINNTFYRMPSEKVLAGWAAQVPEDFRFALKASRRITHFKRLKEAAEDLRYLTETALALGDRLGPVLFQLPPHLKLDRQRLETFVAALPQEPRAAFEFRHSSWFVQEVYDLLREHGAALVTADTGEEGDAPLTATAGYGYLRLRRPDYDDADLEAWVARVKEQPWEEALVFFKHEDEGAGPRLAARFRDLWEASPGSPAGAHVAPAE